MVKRNVVKRGRMRACCLAACLAILPGAPLHAQSFPSRPVRYIMPLPAGGETDIFARMLARQLTDIWGQQVIVDNRPGGGTTIATELAAKTPPDAHVFMHAISAFAINATLYSRLPYDTLKDFACITHIGNLYGVLVAHPSFPVKNVAELVALARKRPGDIAYATGGAGTFNHIAMEAIRLRAGMNVVHVPYKGTVQALPDVLAGRVPLLATVLVEVVPYIQSRKLKVIATTSPRRAPSLPDIPTVTETIPDYRAGIGFWALVTRAGAPPAVVSRFSADAVKALHAPDVRARLAQADIEIVGSRPEQCDTFLRDQVAAWGAIVKASGARVD
jgi:tripartite-type tricarboxylate transporter receptor subunit TctC